MKAVNKKTNEQLYLEYFNDFLTIEYMASHYDIDPDDLSKIIEIGRKDHIKRIYNIIIP